MITKKMLVTFSTTTIIGILLVNNAGKILLNEVNEFNFSVQASPSIVDVGEAVNFRITNLEGTVSQFIFDFHDGSSTVAIDGTETEIQHQFPIEGEYLVSVMGVKAVGELGRVLTQLKVVSVTVQNKAPVVELNIEKNEVWEDELVQFSVGSIIDSLNDVVSMQYQWLFGDGQSANGSSVFHIYTEAGAYEVTLHAIDDQGLVGLSSKSILVENVIPKPVLKVNATQIMEDQAVFFDAQETTDSPSDVESLQFGWDFGDGTFGHGPSTTHKYYEEGSYEVSLSVRDSSGGTSELSIVISVGNVIPSWGQIEVNHSLLPEGQTLIVHSQGIDTPSDQPRVKYRWFLKNKTGQTATWTYFDEQELNITGTLTDDNGASETNEVQSTYYNVPPRTSLLATTMTFNLTLLLTGEKWHDAELKLLDETDNILLNDIIYREPGDPKNQSLSFYNVTLDLTHLWRMEVTYTPENDPINGQPMGANPVHLFVNFSDGLFWNFKHTFNYNFPEGYFWRLPLQPFFNGFPVDLHINYYDPGQDSLTIEVIHPAKQTNLTISAPIFGPNQGVTIITQNFDVSNTTDYFPLTLRITDEDGGDSSSTYLYEAAFGSNEGYQLADVAPRIDEINSSIDVSVGHGWEDEPIEFKILVDPSSIADQTLTYYWVFGDGTTITTSDPSVNHVFASEGLYLVEVTVQGDLYATTQCMLITIDNVKPTGSVENALGQAIEVGKPLLLNASGSYDTTSDINILRFIWDFGNGDTTSGYSAIVTHTYFHSGVYEGSLTILDDNGDMALVEYVVWVENPAPDIELTNQIQMKEGETTILEAQVSDIAFQVPYLEYEWRIEGFHAFQSRINIILDDGSYQGNLTVKDIEGRETTRSFQLIVINQLPQVIFTPHLVYGQKTTSFRIFASALDNIIDYQSLKYRFTIINSISSTSGLLENQEWLPVIEGKIIIDLDLSTLTHGNHILELQIEDPSNTGPRQQQSLFVYWDEDGDNISNTLEAQMGTDETLADTDDDWIIDSQEGNYGTDPSLFDTDNDGLWDGYHASTGIGEFLVNTDPTDPDTDDDSLLDGIEVFGWKITVLMQGGSVSYNEILVYSNPLLEDSDNDGLTDAEEFEVRSNPQASDTDGDGLTDLEEFTQGTPITTAYSPITTLDASLSIDSETTGESAPWTVEFSLSEAFKNDPLTQLVRDNNNELVPTTLTVGIYTILVIWGYEIDWKIGECVLDESGKGRFSYDDYKTRIKVKFAGNNLYNPISTTCYPNYHADEMIQNVGPEDTEYVSSDAVTNAKFKIFRAYIENPGVFSKSGNTYTMVADKAHIWYDVPFGTVLTRGYEVRSSVSFSQEELELGVFDIATIMIRGYFDWIDLAGKHEVREDYYFSKSEFLTFWLSMKLRTWSLYGCPEPDEIERRIDPLAADLVTLLRYEEDDYEANKDDEEFQQFLASIHGRLDLVTSEGFQPATDVVQDFVDFLAGVIEALINFVIDVITFLVDLAVGIVKFLFAVWDELIAPALGSVIKLIKEVVITTVKVVLTIMTKALTGNLQIPIIGQYTTMARNHIRKGIVDMDWAAAGQYLENQYTGFDVKSVTEPLATGVATVLGPLDGVLQIFNFAQILDLPGIISDLASLIGPQLVMTIVSELLSTAISIIITLILQSIGTSNIDGFLQNLNFTSWFSNKIDFLNSMSEFDGGPFTGVTTFSNLIRKIGSLGESQSNSILQTSQIQSRVSNNNGYIDVARTIAQLFTLLMVSTKADIEQLVIDTFIDIISMVVGGFMYLISPVFIERLFDGLLWFITSMAARLIDLYIDLNADTMNENLKVFSTIGSVILSAISWAYIMAPDFGIPWGLKHKYGNRYGYLGANVQAFLFNSLSTAFSTILDFTPVKNWVLNKFPIIEPYYSGIIKFLNYFSKIIAAIITSAAMLETMKEHYDQGDYGIVAGDLLFLLQAGIIHCLLSCDKLFGLLKWLWTKLGFSDSKRTKVLFGVNAVLDAGMLGIFLFVT